MPLELTHTSQKEWKSIDKWKNVYSEVHSSALCEIYGKGALVCKSLLRAKLIKDQADTVLVIGSAVCDLPQAIAETLKNAKRIDWQPQGYRCPKKLHQKIHIIDDNCELKEQEYDVCFDNGDLDRLSFKRGFESVRDRLDALVKSVRSHLVLTTVAHDSILRDIIKVFQQSEHKVRVIRSPPVLPHSAVYVPFSITMSIMKAGSASGLADKEGEAEYNPAIAPGNVLIRQPISHENRWIYREVEISLLRLPRLFKEWRLQSYISRIVPIRTPGVLRFFDIVDEHGNVSYTISMYDRHLNKVTPKTIRQLKACVAVMVPLADDHHWLYRTVSGHQRLAEKAASKRVLCVFLPSFKPLQVENESASQIVERIRRDIGTHLIQLNSDPKKPVLLMTQQEKFEDERVTVTMVKSEVQGDIHVYDVPVDTHDEEFKEDPEADTEYQALEPSEFTRRTLIMASNPRVAQTEVWYRKDDKGDVVFEFTHICHSYQIPILQAVHAMLNHTTCQLSGALLGTGGGLLYSLFQGAFGDSVMMECVEIDPTIIDLARKYFGYNNERTVIGDAIDYVAEKAKSERKLDFLVVDINGSVGETYPSLEDVTGPHKNFLQPEFLYNAASCVSEAGCVMFNSVCQTSQAKKALGSHLKTHFPEVVSVVFGDELNVVFLCFSEESGYLAGSFSGVRNKLLKSADRYPVLAAVVEKTPLYLGANSKSQIIVRTHTS